MWGRDELTEAASVIWLGRWNKLRLFQALRQSAGFLPECSCLRFLNSADPTISEPGTGLIKLVPSLRKRSSLIHLFAADWKIISREFTQRRRRRQRERQKSDRFRQAKQLLCTCITLFCTFLCRCCTTTTWNCLISRFVEDGNKFQQLSFSFPELWCSPLEFNSEKHLPTFDELNKMENARLSLRQRKFTF